MYPEEWATLAAEWKAADATADWKKKIEDHIAEMKTAAETAATE